MIKRLLGHKLVQNTLLLYVVQFSGYILPLLVLPYLSRVLTPEKFGLIAFAQAFIWYFITLVEYGFNLTATRRIAIARDDLGAVSRIFSAVMTAKLVLLIFGFVLAIAVVFATPRLRSDWSLFVVSYLAVLGNFLFPQWLFQGMQRMGQVAARDFIAKLVTLAAVFLFVRTNDDYMLAAAVQGGGPVIAGVISLIWMRRIVPVSFHLPSAAAVLSTLKEGWAVFLSMAVMTLFSSTNVFILGLYATPEAVAWYSAAHRIVVALRMMVSPLTTAIYPHISHLAANSEEAAIRFLRKYTMVLAAPFLAGSIVLFVGAPLFVRIIYGEQYAAAADIMRIMSFSPFLLALAHCYTTFYMLAFGHEKAWSKLIMGAAVLNFAVLIPLLLTIRPEIAVAITTPAVDIFSVAGSYLFYRRHALTKRQANERRPDTCSSSSR